MADVFISYVEEDGSIAQSIAAALESAGYSTWYYQRDSLPGSSYLKQTAEEIDKARVVVLIISPGSMASRQITIEVIRGHESGKPFIPVLRSITHEEFQRGQPEWRQALGATASIPIPEGTLPAVMPRILRGARALLEGEADSMDEVDLAAVPGELHLVAVLSAGVAGTELIADALHADEVEALLSECHSAMARVIADHGGESLSHEQGVIGVFGFPTSHEDDPERAARTALRIVENVSALAEDLRSAWGIGALSPRVAIDTGPLEEGELKDPEAAGARATALRAVPTDTSIVVSEKAAHRLRSRFRLTAAGDGTAFGLVEEMEAPTPATLPPMVNRERELSLMEESIGELLAGRGQILLVMGKPGIGKSRLLLEVQSRAERRGVTWLQGRCLSYGEQLSYWPLVEILRTYLGVAEGEAEVAVRLRLRARMKSVLGEHTDEVLPYIARLLSLRLDPQQEEKVRYLSPDALAEQIHSAYRTWLQALSDRAPVVLCLEDLHWADPSTRALAEGLLEAAEGAPLAIVASFRDDPDTEAWRFRLKVMEDYSHRAREVLVKPLGDAEAAELARTVAGPDEIHRAALPEIITRAEGNPLYVEQLLRSVVEATRAGADPQEAAASLEQLTPALEGLLVSRIDQLPAEARRLAQVGAVAGRSFLRRVLDKVVEDGDVDRGLTALVKAGIVREYRRVPELEYMFAHGLIQDAAASTLADWRRKQIHGHMADAFVELFSAGLDDYLDIVAHHYLESDDRENALEYSERAGIKASALYANEQAIELLHRARDLARELDQPDVYRRITENLAQILVRIGDLRSLALHSELAERATDESERARLFAHAASAATDLESGGDASAFLERGLELAPSPIDRIRLLQVGARLAFRPFKDEEMRAILEEIETLTEGELPVKEAMMQARLWNLYYASRGDLDEARSWTEREVELAEKADDVVRVVDAKHNLAVSLYEVGDLLGARKTLEEVVDRSQTMGYARMIVSAATNLTWVCYLTGDLEQGRRFGLEADRLAVNPFFHGLALVYLSAIEREMGEAFRAKAHLESALAMADRVGDDEVSVEASIGLAALDVLGEPGSSHIDRALEDAHLRAQSLGENHPLRIAAHYWLAELRLRRDEPGPAEVEARKGLEIAKAGSPDLAVPLYRLIGTARERRSPRSGGDVLATALERARSLGMRLEEGRILVTQAVSGLVDESEQVIEAAKARLLECGALRDLDELERS